MLCSRSLLDLEDVLNVGDAKGAVERGQGTVGGASEVRVDGLHSDARIGQGNGLANGLDDRRREARADEAHELRGQGDAAESRLDLIVMLALLPVVN